MTRTPRLMLLSALGCVVAFVALMLLAYYSGAARFVDDAALYGFTQLNRGVLHTAASSVASICDPLPFAVLGIAAMTAATLTRGLRYGVAAGMILVGANASTQVLKPLLAHPRPFPRFGDFPMHAASYPSGHATASMTLALAAVMLLPRERRPLVAVLGGIFSLIVSFSVVVKHWHYPSDVVGGYLVATTWTLVALAALRYAAVRWPQEGTMRRAARGAAPSLRTIGIGAAVVAALAVLVAATRAGQVVDFAQHYTAAVAVGAAIAVSAALLLAGVTALSRRRR